MIRYASIIATLAALALISPAWAADATKLASTPLPSSIDFTRPLLGIDRKPILHPTLDPAGKPIPGAVADPITIGETVANCLVQEKAANGQGPALWKLAMKINGASNVTLDASEVHAIEACVADKSPIMSGQIDPMIDPNFKVEPLK